MNKADTKAINTIRILGAEAIQKAKSGHPGIVMGAAPIIYTLWTRHLKHNPSDSQWKNRDRFILSAGHGSMLLYSMLYLFDYGLTKEDIKNFRQFGSLTPGHPEYGQTNGVEVTTGPLGQGVANGVGMALAEAHLAAVFNRDGFDIVDHYTYVLCGDGCMMEGISSEAASIAATMGLGKLILIYDSNNISIEGSTDVAFTESVADRYKAYGWQVITVNDGNDIDAIDKAISEAKKDVNVPALIEVKTTIGFGSPNKAGSAASHGAPLGEEELALTKKNLGWEYEEDFYLPEDVKEVFDNIRGNLAKDEEKWNELYRKYSEKYPELAKEFEDWYDKDYAKELIDDEDFWNFEEDKATRQSSEIMLNKIAKVMPNLFGGSADLSPSNLSIMKDREYYSKDNKRGSNIHFGVREHAMAAMCNGIVLHGGLKAYNAGFFVFSDYMKPALRLASIMKLPVISIFTHDSIGVGEDGPTHQPVEQLAALRSMPNYTVFRPCDTKETAAAWYTAVTSKDSPTGIVLTRQKTKLLKETGKGALKGGYVIRDSKKDVPDMILMASGSEVELIYDAWEKLQEKGIDARVVSMPCFEKFDEQSDEYKESVLPKNVRKRLAVEAAVDFGWHKYIGIDGDIICMDSYGKSAPFAKLFEKFGFTADNVVERAERLMKI
ncbi:MAG: transketolase [Firmicutes bacterium]|nr:transketolase [Bacillota bacterium]